MKKNCLNIKKIGLMFALTSIFFYIFMSIPINSVIAMRDSSAIEPNTNAIPLICPNATTIPIIDGLMAPGEWNDARRYYFFFTPTSPHPPDNISIFIKNNETHLFIALDVEPDNSSESSDTSWLYFDLNNNNTRDLSFEARRSGTQFVNQRGVGGIGNIDFTVAFGFNLTGYESSRNHTIVEWVISINRTEKFFGQDLSSATKLPLGINPIGVVFAGYGTLDPEWQFGNNTNAKAWTSFDANNFADLILYPKASTSDRDDFLLLTLLLSAPPSFPWVVFGIIVIAIGFVIVILIVLKTKK